MYPRLAATLICACCHTATLAGCEDTACRSAPPVQPVRLMATAVADGPPKLHPASATDAPQVLYAQATASGSDAPKAQPAPRSAVHDSNTLLIVGLALMVGIALRRWGAAHR